MAKSGKLCKGLLITKENRRKVEELFDLEPDTLLNYEDFVAVKDFGDVGIVEGYIHKDDVVKTFERTDIKLDNDWFELKWK